MMFLLKQIIQINIINKFHIKNFKNKYENFHKWYSDLKLFFDSEELGYYIKEY